MAATEDLERALGTHLMECRTPSDVSEILKIAESLYGPLGLRPVGDRPNNSGTIRYGSVPALGVVERTVNMIDAVLDLAHHRHPGEVPTSPRDAARRWFNVPEGGLSEMTESERRQIGETMRIWLDDSGNPKRPTVVFDDRGIGQAPERFITTLVSLNEGNKVGQSWTAGTYGQGGAVCFGFSEATVIVSRRHPDFNEFPDRVGWTIVRRIENPSQYALPNYQLIVGPDGNVPHLPVTALADLPFGTRIIHVAYDLQTLTGPFTTGLWQFMNAAMFDPVLPFLISGKRRNESSYGTRIITGNAARLQRPDHAARGDLDVAHRGAEEFDLGPDLGRVRFNYWVLSRPAESESDTDPAASYVRADSAVSMTLFGQRQDTLHRTWIKDQARLPFLYKNMVVQVSADGLTAVAKSEVFSSTRERATKSDTLDRIYDRLAAVLREDDVLLQLNHLEKERLLSRSASAASEKVRKRLAKFVKTRLKNAMKPGPAGDTSGGEGRPSRPPGGRSRAMRSIDDQDLGHFPTRFRFVTIDRAGSVVPRKEPMQIAAGGRAHTWVEVDAKNGYLPAHNDDLTLIWPSDLPDGAVKLTMRSDLLGGLSRWTFEAEESARLGDFTLSAELVTANGVLKDSLNIRVTVKPTTKSSTRKGEIPETGPEVHWVVEADWPDHNGMDERTVGYVTVDDESTDIWLNRDYEALKKALASRSLSHEAIETRKMRYEFPIACALWLQNHEASQASVQPDEKYQKAEKQRLAEAVLVAIDPDVDVAMEESES